MNDKIRNTLLIVCVVIVLLIFVDLVFNFTGIMVEKFQAAEDTDAISIDNKNIKSIVSKQDGRIFNVTFVKTDTDNKTMCISSPTKSNANIYYSGNGTLGEQLKNSAEQQQQFIIHHIVDADAYETVFNLDLGSDTSSSCIKYPFYIIVPKNDSSSKHKRCISYEPGRLFLANGGNYRNQHWDVSNQLNLNTDSIATHDVNNSSYGSLNTTGDKTGSTGEIYDPNKIKINLNLTDELKKQLFGISGGDGSGGGSGSGSGGGGKCGAQISKDALSSLCKGCDADKF